MTNLKQLLGFNIRQYRAKADLTQAKLAEKAGSSTQYIAMIELGKKFPSLDVLERIAAALEIDNLDLFTPPPFPAENLLKLQSAFLADLDREISSNVNKAVQNAVETVIDRYLLEE